MAELAAVANSNGDATDYSYGSDPNNPYTWDGYRIYGCHCDAGWQGYDCALREWTRGGGGECVDDAARAGDDDDHDDC
jgi:hypothetical protein